MTRALVITTTAGWTFVGVEAPTIDGHLRLIEAKNVRMFGTAGGASSLAGNGPTRTTVLDHYGTVSVNPLETKEVLEARTASWLKIFPSLHS